MRHHLGKEYSPVYFLASLGNGGLAVSFFIYLMFTIPHPGTPMVTFDHIYPVLTAGNGFISALIVIALAGILYFAFRHYQMLFWNIKEYQLFKKTPEYIELKQSNAAVSLMAIPLTLAMSINVFFVIGATFIPGLWNVIELLLPFALLGFLAVGIYGLKIFTDYFSRYIVKGNFDFTKNNNLSQMLAIFAFTMIAVGFAAPAAMSHQTWVFATGIFFSLLFATISLFLATIKLTLGFKSIFKQGIAKEGGATLWIIIPI